MAYKDAKTLFPAEFQQNNYYSIFDMDVIIPIGIDLKFEREFKNIVRNKSSAQMMEKPLGVWKADNLSPVTPQPWYFRLLDLCAVCAGLMGFVSGFLNFHMNPR